MYLKELELIGFKSFAKKTTLNFPARIVAVVGPNGTGKSNIVDAIRWVLAEQSFKTLRGKKGEDLIFHGGASRGALSRARVSLTLEGVAGLGAGGGSPDFDEVVITRAVSRNGDNTYSLNGRQVRLMDLEAYLSKSGIGASSFRVLSQGMSDMLIRLGPDEFRAFVEDAAGVTEFQDKRRRSALKLQTSEENLEKVSALLAELAPRARFLKRETGKINRRDKVEAELAETVRAVFSLRWDRFSKKEKSLGENKKKIETRIEAANKKINQIKKELFSSGVAAGAGELTSTEEEVQKLRAKEHTTQKNIIILEGRLERAQMEQKFSIPPLELGRALSEILKDGEELLVKPYLRDKRFEGFISRLRSLVNKIGGGPKDEDKVKALRDKIEKTRAEGEKIRAELEKLNDRFKKIKDQSQGRQENFSKKEQEFEDAHEQVRALEKEQNSLELEEEKIKIRKEGLLHDLKSLGVMTLAEVLSVPPPKNMDEEKIEQKMWLLKKKLEQIGGIDPAIEDEYKGVKERFEFLEREKEDLEKMLEKLERVIADLDREIKKRFVSTLSEMSDRFGEYVKLMFNGGKANLYSGEDGIEINVELPGKKIKGLSMLSGGERTLVSIALLFSLVTIRKPPFLVLDEIDAALDETNSEKFIRLLEELSKETQFIIITHNRATMRGADALYGVSMKDGVSNLLSLKLEDTAPLTN